MSAPTVTRTPLGVRTEYRYNPPFVRADWQHMEELIGDLTMQGCSPMRLICDDSVRIVVTTIEDEK